MSPKRHEPGFFNLHQPEINAIHSLLDKVKREIEALDSSVTGFNIGVNNGQDAGQTIFHCHIHLIPRRKGDTGNPRGGVRGAPKANKSTRLNISLSSIQSNNQVII